MAQFYPVGCVVGEGFTDVNDIACGINAENGRHRAGFVLGPEFNKAAVLALGILVESTFYGKLVAGVVYIQVECRLIVSGGVYISYAVNSLIRAFNQYLQHIR